MSQRLLFLLGLGVLASGGGLLRAEDTTLPGTGFETSRYEVLWTKSPFAVASSDAVPESTDYALVGIAQFDGISYASIVDNQKQDHFLLSSNQPAKGMTLVSINKAKDGAAPFAVIQKDGGQALTLKLQITAATPTAAAGDAGGGMPVVNAPPPQIPMPGAPDPGQGQGQSPRVMMRPHIRHLPPHPQMIPPAPPVPPPTPAPASAPPK